MKIIAIGDLHGHDSWKKIIKDNPDADKIVFIADYIDSFDIPADKQKKNFKEIIALKKKHKDLVELLIGNHEMHYLRTSHKKYAGYQKYQRYEFEKLLTKAINDGLMKMCYVHDNFLFTHAGVTKTWCQDNNINPNNIEQDINDLFTYKPNSFEFISGGDLGGDNCYQSPTWVRPNSLRHDKIDNYIQIVGHTDRPKLVISDDGVIIIDTLGRSGQYLIINDGVMTASEDLTDIILLRKVVQLYQSSKK